MGNKEFNAVKFCEDYNIEFWTEGKNVSPGWISVQCPFCDDSSNHGGFNPYGGYFSCWKCGHHSLYDAVREFTGVKNPYHILKMYDWIDVKEEQLEEKVPFEIPGGPLQQPHREYLIGRRFDPDYIEEKYKVRGTLHHDKYPYRIITPVIYNEEIVSFLGRDFTGIQDKRHKDCSRNMAKIHHKQILYNLDNTKSNRVLVVEGAYDTWRIGDGCVATLGTGWKQNQLNLLAERFKTIFILFDKGVEAQESSVKLASALDTRGVDANVISTEYAEPDDMPENDVKYLKKELGLYAI